MSIRIRTILVIVFTNLAIILFSVSAGVIYVSNSIEESQEMDLAMMANIADHFISSEIEVLKLKADVLAQNLTVSEDTKWTEVLTSLETLFPEFIGMAVLDADRGLVASAGELPAVPELMEDKYIKRAFAGEKVISSTMPSTHGVVFYLAIPMPGAHRRILALTIPGMHFAERLSTIVIWKTGHIFIDDEEGHIIANARREWVQNRVNFLHMSQTDKQYEEIAGVIRQGVRGETGVGRFSISGIPRICAFKPIAGSKEGWFLGVIAPLPDSPFRDINRGLIMVGFVAFLLSVVTAVIVSTFIKKPFEEIEVLKAAAEESSKSKSNFLANMSHEIRTPMNSIVGFSELAMDDEISPKTREYLDKIVENSKWLLQIINDVLDLSKIESGKLELENIPFNLHDVFSRCQTAIMPKALENGIQMYCYAEPSVGKKLVGDPIRLSQVLINLLSNAVKFTNFGMVKLLSSIISSTDEGVTIRFEVKDSGVGMTPEQISRIFEPFAQADSSTTRKYGGTGLGLPITRNIIQLMGGKLMLESISGIGSRFSFELTFDTIDVPAGASDVEISTDQVEKPFFKGEILLCEDNDMNQRVICEHLARVGLETVVAVNGKEGVDMVQSRMKNNEKPFDLIFMDVQMPVMDGLDATRAIMRLGSKTPIVAMTANVMTHDRDFYKTSGMSDCVGKPFTSQELWHCLLKYLTPGSPQIINEKIENRPTMTDEKLYLELRTDFVKGNQTKFAEITRAVDEGDIKLAHRLAHTLKSNAELIGKSGLKEAAAVVEHMLKDGSNLASEEHMNALEAELNAALKELAPLLYGIAAPPSPAFDEGKAREIAELLEPLLKGGNTECLAFVDSLRAMPGSEELIQHMDDFNFASAIAALAELKKKWGCG
ncbi:MAG: ATP-binding protein [Synergistaceae bacterium]|nr:ATP-binding protein [Synergistaceae bacterium]